MRPFGLRSRLLAALVATSVVTLVAAAAALLSPLQERLRDQNAQAIQAAVQSARPQISALIAEGLREKDPFLNDATAAVNDLAGRTGARASLFCVPAAAQRRAGRSSIPANPCTFYGPVTTPVVELLPATSPVSGTLPEVFALLRQAVPNTRLVTRTTKDTRVTVPFSVPPGAAAPRYVLAVRKANTDVSDSVGEVRKAFVKAALIGFTLALGLALIFASTLSRRLARLRRAALRIMRDGTTAPPPVDEGRDEVGDLARAMGAMQQGLRRQEEARRRFVATASHELRTPLTSASGTLELLGEDLAAGDLDREDALSQVQAARRELARLRSLADELLDLSRLDAGVELRAEPVELAELTRAVAAELEIAARSRRQRLEVVPPPGPCWALGDPSAVARIARILLDNALRYSPEGSEVRVVAAYRGDRAELEVRDEGPGVPEEDREVVFERFERGAGGTARAGGFGLGLAIGRELAERQGGTLVLVPREAGSPGGARFVLSLAIELPAGSRRAELTPVR